MPGSDESFLVNGLQPKTRYHFAAKVADEVPNWSAICDGATALTPDTVVITWARTFGGRDSENQAQAIEVIDNGFIFAGETSSYSIGWSDIYVVKTDELGNTQWYAHYGTARDEDAGGLCITHDLNHLIVGSTGFSSDFESDGLLLKLDANGEMLWWKTYSLYTPDSSSPISYSADCIYDVASVPDGGYVIPFEGGWLMKVDEGGDSTWLKRYGEGVWFVVGNAVAVTDDGGFVLAGRTGDGEQGGAYVYKVNAVGELIWDKAFSFGADSWFAYSICIAPDGYVMAGFSADMMDAVVAKVDDAGGLLWEKRFGGPNYERINAVCCAANGGYVVAGGTNAFDEGEDVYLFKVDDSGNLIWERTYGGEHNDHATSVALCKDGGFIVAATTYSYGQKSQIWLLKLDSEGRLFE
jgi:WD40 repeat protein